MHHLSIDEIEKITDTSDLSTEYLTWYESVEEHIAECPLCREQIRRKILCDDLTDGSILQEGITLLGKEEEIRRNIVIYKLQQKSITDQSIVNALQKQRYVQSALTAKRANHAVSCGEKEQDELEYEWHDNNLKIRFFHQMYHQMYQQIDLEKAKVILLDKSMNVKMEKVSVDEHGDLTACFENVEQIDDAIVYIVE